LQNNVRNLEEKEIMTKNEPSIWGKSLIKVYRNIPEPWCKLDKDHQKKREIPDEEKTYKSSSGKKM
jgi:hypothetical protein